MMKSVFVIMVICEGLSLSDKRWSSLLSEDRISKVKCLRCDKDRAMSIGAELAVLAALKANRIECSDPIYYYDDRGKPQLCIAGQHISLSHSGGLAVCALSDTELGVDIETPRRINNSLARAVLSPDESESSNSNEILLRKWVIKESYFKLTGEGIDRHSMTGITAVDGKIYKGAQCISFYDTVLYPRPECIVSCCAYEPVKLAVSVYTSDELAALLNK